MVPLLALVLYSSLTLYLLGRYDLRQANRASGAMWVPTIWMFSIATRPFGVWFGGQIEDVETGSPLDQICVSGLLCLGLLILANRKLNWRAVRRQNTWLIVL